jgi:hypothetical protein
MIQNLQDFHGFSIWLGSTIWSMAQLVFLSDLSRHVALGETGGTLYNATNPKQQTGQVMINDTNDWFLLN